jgi:ribonucleotide reductase beta subunit family protein with ferritin-like domain
MNIKIYENEQLLSKENNRFVLFPIKHNDIWSMCKKQLDCFWRAEEIDLSRDLKDWNSLTGNEKHFISMVLAFFAASDGIVLENLALRFIDEVKLAEARYFYSNQMLMENIHSETYSLLIDTYIRDNREKLHLFNAIEFYPCIRKKADWAQDYINCNDSFATRLLAFAVVEGIFFSGAFCSIFWLKKRGLLPGLCFSNELISRDEALHTEFAVLLYSKLNVRLRQEEVYSIVDEAVDIEKEFIIEALPCRLIGMNAELMNEYIEFVADRLLIQLGYSKLYNTENPFSFMEMISLEGKGNFFERRISDYALAEKEKTEQDFDLDEDCF